MDFRNFKPITMEFSKKQEEQIINFGAFGYSAEKIANILKLPYKDVFENIQDPKSQLSILIQKGKDMSDYVIDLKLFELAKTGDLKALEKFEMRKRKRK